MSINSILTAEMPPTTTLCSFNRFNQMRFFIVYLSFRPHSLTDRTWMKLLWGNSLSGLTGAVGGRAFVAHRAFFPLKEENAK